MDAHLVFDRAAAHAVALAYTAFGVGQELRHDEQRDALGASRCVRQAGQDDMDDVVGHVVLTGRNEDLGARHFVAAVGLWLGLGAQHAQVGTAVRLGQAHGAGPLAGYQLGQVSVLLLGSTMRRDGVHRAVRQARVHAPRPVRTTDHFAQGQAQRFRQALAAVLDVMRQARPAAFDELFVGLFEAGRGFHARFAPGAAFLVTHAVQWRQHLLTELRAFFEDRIDHVGRGVLATRQALIVRLIAEQLVANEADITQGGFVIRHCDEPLGEFCGVTRTWRPSIKQLFETYV
ncbi:hypothetical protein D3C75_800470 [compost metagenome]